MKTIKNLQRLQKTHELIKCECTGTPSELAKNLSISERSVYNLIEQLRDLNASIFYDRGRKTYYYHEDFQLKVNISIAVISNNEITKISR
ncbi:HTH domain-containing protein [Ulvibacterium sp.]|uniref:HTH domain-containing protein n=1 Tax=Ulvibacterium sp. TaxID=2665914 RepID=UPI00260CB588|nr:HTH domain-containing protein [Ulvibacterium sp.]